MQLKVIVFLSLLLCCHGAVRSSGTLPDLLVSLEFDRTEAFIKEQVIATLKIGYPPGAFGMTHSPFKASNADLHILKKTKYIEEVEEIPYSFVQTRYALFGNTAGTMDISAINFNALLPVAAGGVNSTVNPTIKAVIQPHSLTVLAVPAHDSASDKTVRWLAASDLTIKAHWNLTDEILSPGLPVQRQVIVDIVGQHPASVPVRVDWNMPDGMRAYPGVALNSLVKSDTGLRGSVTMPVQVVASRAGSFQLPEITIPWWDINQRQWRQSTLAAETLEVIAGRKSSDTYFYKGAVLALGMICTGLLLWCFALWRQVSINANRQSVLSERQLWKKIQKTIKRREYPQLRKDTLLWARALYNDPSIVRLDQLYDCHPKLQGLFSETDKAIYGDGKYCDFHFDSDELVAALTTIRRDYFSRREDSSKSRGLYPES